MKQLDLTDWQNAEWETRDGRPVRLLCVDRDGGACGLPPLVGLIRVAGGETEETWCPWGGTSDKHNRDNDLIRKPKKIKGWVNIYPGRMSDLACCVAIGGHARIACIPIEFEEGEGL